MAITAQLVKELRERTGAGMMDCKGALEHTNGNIEEAIDYLREKGIAKAAKKAGRIAAEGLCNVEIEGNEAVIFELNSETDFVSKNEKFLEKWKTGMTGYPIVDAGMRELYQTGWMHNRVRMIVASFLVKHLRIHWMEGEKHFQNCLVDYNQASNVAQWQWVAGCGADAAPYFRIFNPILQGEKFDKDGIYTKKWVPELKNMPNKFLYKPWELETKYQEQIKVVVGINYPKPIVDHVEARNAALNAFKTIKKN